MSDEPLDATLAGTFGSIRDTLQHIVAAERVTGLPPRLYNDTMWADASASLPVDKPCDDDDPQFSIG